MRSLSRRDLLRKGAGAAVAGGLWLAAPQLLAGDKGGRDRKKGVCGGIRGPEGLVALKAAWYYTWRAGGGGKTPDGIEFVPQIFPHKSEPIKGACEKLKAAGCRVLLGYNEPDSDGQGSLSVKEAIEYWPLLESTGAKLISPATTWASNGWMKDFMKQAEQKKLRIDAVAIHWYGGPNAHDFLRYVETAHKDYRKPIWITEFCVSDKKAGKEKPTKITPQDVMRFAKNVLPELERLDWVDRYCWYTPHKLADPRMGPSCLLDDNGGLTELGKFFAGVS